jgi:transposase
MLGRGLSLAEIGKRFDLHESTISYWLKQHGLEAANRDKHAARGGVPRADLEALVDGGMSIAQIAAAVGRSKATVRHWLMRYGLKTRGGHGRRPAEQRRPPRRLGSPRSRCAAVATGRPTFGSTDAATTAASDADRPRSSRDAERSRRSWSRRQEALAASAATTTTCAHCTSIMSSRRRSVMRSTPGGCHCPREAAGRGAEVRASVL